MRISPACTLCLFTLFFFTFVIPPIFDDGASITGAPSDDNVGAVVAGSSDGGGGAASSTASVNARLPYRLEGDDNNGMFPAHPSVPVYFDADREDLFSYINDTLQIAVATKRLRGVMISSLMPYVDDFGGGSGFENILEQEIHSGGGTHKMNLTFVIGCCTGNKSETASSSIPFLSTFVALPRWAMPFLYSVAHENSPDSIQQTYESATRQLRLLLSNKTLMQSQNRTIIGNIPKYWATRAVEQRKTERHGTKKGNATRTKKKTSLSEAWSVIDERESKSGIDGLRLALEGACVWLGTVSEYVPGERIRGTLISESCDIMTPLPFELTSDESSRRYTQVQIFVVLCVIFGLIQNYAMLRFLNFSATGSQMLHVAPFAIYWSILFDFCAVLLYSALARMFYRGARGLIACTFFNFAMFSLWDIKIVTRIHNSRAAAAGVENSTRMWVVYLRLWVGLVFTVSLFTKLRPFAPTTISCFLFSHWWPQIVYNVRNGTTRGSPPEFVILTSICRLWPLLYFNLYDGNFVPFRPMPDVVLFTTGWYGLQVVILLVQSRAWVFAPGHVGHCVVVLTERLATCLGVTSARYDYYPAGLVVPEEHECAVCRCPIAAGAAGGIPSRTASSDAVSADDPERPCITPCGHIFHAQCLMRWADEKLVCPICRRNLPVPP